MKHEADYVAQDVGALLSWAMNGERVSIVSGRLFLPGLSPYF